MWENNLKLYLEYHQHAWAPATLKSESARLNRIIKVLKKTEDPQRVFLDLKEQVKPYTLQTMFTRLIHFYGWLLEQGLRTGPNSFLQWKKKNAQLFKYSYKREKLNVTFEEAKNLITSIDDKEARDVSCDLLFTGMRLHEVEKMSGDSVIGKGGKERKIFFKVSKTKVSQYRLRKALKKVGLKPHSLRKLFATQLGLKGARPEDLCEILGWSSISTAFVYLQPKKDEELKSLVSNL